MEKEECENTHVRVCGMKPLSGLILYRLDRREGGSDEKGCSGYRKERYRGLESGEFQGLLRSRVGGDVLQSHFFNRGLLLTSTSLVQRHRTARHVLGGTIALLTYHLHFGDVLARDRTSTPIWVF